MKDQNTAPPVPMPPPQPLVKQISQQIAPAPPMAQNVRLGPPVELLG